MRRALLHTLPLLALILSGCPHQPTPIEVFEEGSYDRALEDQKILASQPGEEQSLENLRLASMALAMGDEALAESALRFSVPRMQSFEADGEWQAILGAEESKEWKGEPYEKMMACLYLGCLLYEKGDLGNALAMFKSSILADTGTSAERYRSDFLPAWAMQALTYRALGEDSNADQAASRATDGLYSRVVVEALSKALQGVKQEGDQKALAAARVVLLFAIPAGVSVHPRDPVEAARAATSQATDVLRVQIDKKKKERIPSLQPFSTRALREAFEQMGPLVERWNAAVQAIPPSSFAQAQAAATALESVLRDPPSVILLVEAGRGPRKIATGRYSEELRIVPARHAPSVPRPSLAGAPISAAYLDSLSWQATTRGGRRVDAFLKGKAVFKDASLITGQVLMSLGDVAHAAENDQAAAAMQIIGLVVYIAGAFTNPAADTREWGLIPDQLWLVAQDLPPGHHEITLDHRTFSLEVPEQGGLFGLIPRLPPGGASEIGTR